MRYPSFDGPYGHDLAWLRGLFLLLIVIAIVAGAVLVVRLLLQHRVMPPPPGPVHTSAQAELDMRYARGDIDRDEYLQRRADLAGGAARTAPPPPPPPAR